MLKRMFVIARLRAIPVIIGILLLSSISCGDSGPLTVGKLKDKDSSIYNQEVELSGRLVSDSMDWNSQNRVLKFVLTDGQDSLNMAYQRADSETMSKMLAPNVDLILTGEYNATGVFNVSSIDPEEIPYCQSCHKP